MVTLGQQTPNILVDKDMVYKQNFTLPQAWTNLAAQLDLADDDDTGVATKRAYLIYLWLYAAKEQGFARTESGGDYQLGVIGNIGARGMDSAITTMQLELPMLITGNTLAEEYVKSGLSCLDWYTTNLGITGSQANNLCSQAVLNKMNFTWSDPL